jgi:hypothetical protein
MTTVLVAFADAWLTDVATGVSVTGSFPVRASTEVVAGSIRFYAGGRRRSITTPNRTRTYPITLQWLNDSDAAQVAAWKGRVLLLRDTGGRRVFGTFFQADFTDTYQAAGTRHSAAFTFSELDYSEAV